MINDSDGNPGVAQLSPAAQAALNQLRDQVLAGATFNRIRGSIATTGSCHIRGRGASA